MLDIFVLEANEHRFSTSSDVVVLRLSFFIGYRSDITITTVAFIISTASNTVTGITITATAYKITTGTETITIEVITIATLTIEIITTATLLLPVTFLNRIYIYIYIVSLKQPP